MSAILFGSISSVADTSELQRAAFNQAFRAHGLDWQWDQDRYRSMLAASGGQNRIAEYARSTGQDVDAKAVHETKSKIFQDGLTSASLTSRPGVAAIIRSARDAGWRVALVTTTARANVAALLDGLDDVSDSDFDLITDVASVDRPKPDPEVYAFAVDELGETPTTCVAIEDNVGGVTAAAAAGVPVVAFPNENTAGNDFPGAARTVDWLSFDDLNTLAGH